MGDRITWVQPWALFLVQVCFWLGAPLLTKMLSTTDLTTVCAFKIAKSALQKAHGEGKGNVRAATVLRDQQRMATVKESINRCTREHFQLQRATACAGDCFYGELCRVTEGSLDAAHLQRMLAIVDAAEEVVTSLPADLLKGNPIDATAEIFSYLFMEKDGGLSDFRAGFQLSLRKCEGEM